MDRPRRGAEADHGGHDGTVHGHREVLLGLLAGRELLVSPGQAAAQLVQLRAHVHRVARQEQVVARLHAPGEQHEQPRVHRHRARHLERDHIGPLGERVKRGGADEAEVGHYARGGTKGGPGSERASEPSQSKGLGQSSSPHSRGPRRRADSPGPQKCCTAFERGAHPRGQPPILAHRRPQPWPPPAVRRGARRARRGALRRRAPTYRRLPTVLRVQERGARRGQREGRHLRRAARASHAAANSGASAAPPHGCTCDLQ